MDTLSLLFGFSGRIGRAQFWLGYVIQIAITIVGYVCLLYGEQNESIAALVAALILFVPVIWIGICVMAKRYHDRDKSAWWILIAFIPIIGGIWQLIELGLLKGTEGTNDYGPDPCHSFNVGDDIENLRRQAGHRTAVSGAQPVATAAAPRPRSPYTDGRPVFGKRA